PVVEAGAGAAGAVLAAGGNRAAPRSHSVWTIRYWPPVPTRTASLPARAGTEVSAAMAPLAGTVERAGPGRRKAGPSISPTGAEGRAARAAPVAWVGQAVAGPVATAAPRSALPSTETRAFRTER